MLRNPLVVLTRPGVAVLAALLPLTFVAGVAAQDATAPAQSTPAAAPDPQAERASINQWRMQRIESLTSDSGWLTLAGLFWLKDGGNSFGRDPGNSLVLDNPSLAATAGSFAVSERKVRFIADPEGGVTHAGQPVETLALQSDATAEPTVLESGTLRFYVIERAGNLGVRVRDLNNPRRLQFRGLSYFPVSTDWVLNARFVRYEPVRHIRIVNILGMEEEQVSPGAVVFTHNGREWRLDTVLEQPDDPQLFIMFADATSGHETYGGGRFLYIPRPAGGTATLDFNKAYNPPCALNDFATCPLPPPQNRLKLRIEAGEKTYAGAPAHHS
ncbi:MAG TPA: DUF1684 domain-containing protein [Steroidobacteraceae bacterium]|jgi:uncharacterized protein (DUF1684 family)|nr:DUF1684 domain-containing protein [Steroidobacteraceae bacterium]